MTTGISGVRIARSLIRFSIQRLELRLGSWLIKCPFLCQSGPSSAWGSLHALYDITIQSGARSLCRTSFGIWWITSMFSARLSRINPRRLRPMFQSCCHLQLQQNGMMQSMSTRTKFLGVVNQMFYTSLGGMRRCQQWHLPCFWIRHIQLRPDQSRLILQHICHTIIRCSKMIIPSFMAYWRKPFAGLFMNLPSRIFRGSIMDVGIEKHYCPSKQVNKSGLLSFGMQSCTST